MKSKQKTEFEFSAGAVIFFKPPRRYRPKDRKQRAYLLLQYSETYWGLAKGHIETKETSLAAAEREILEETGLRVQFLRGFKEKERYFFRRKGVLVFKQVTYFLARSFSKRIRLSSEHQDYLWLPYQEAREKLTYKNAKQLLDKAEQFLQQRKGVAPSQPRISRHR